MKESFNGLILNLKEHKTTVMVVLGIAGILLILFSELFKPSSASSSIKKDVTQTETQYVKELEKKLKTMVSGIEGAGDCDVVVTLESGEEYIYAIEQSVDSTQSTDNSGAAESRSDVQRNTEDKYILKRNADGSEEPLLLKKNEPTVRGVVVLSTGAGRISVQQRIIDSVMTALNITSNRICVIQKSK